MEYAVSLSYGEFEDSQSSGKCVSILGKWVVLEYEHPSARKLISWSFPNFNEAEQFCHEREEFYRSIGLDRKRRLTLPVPEISREEIEMFKEILGNPELLRRVQHKFAV